MRKVSVIVLLLATLWVAAAGQAAEPRRLLTADDEGRLSVEFRRVPVDVDAIVAQVEACGMPGTAEGAWRWRPSSRP